ncbi:MAG: hypothetical protein QOF82_1968 [Frankiales bacterium]|nr:hypothetical protein [Frankiales bacterium]
MRKSFLSVTVTLLVLAWCAPAQAAFNDRPDIENARATDVTTTSATFKADVTFNEKAAEWWFTYCRESDCANGETSTPHQTTDIPDDNAAVTPQPIQWSVSDLVPSNVYRVVVHAQSDTWNDNNGDPNHMAAVKSFNFTSAAPAIPPTPVPPSATTQQPTGVTPYAATFNGTAVPGTTGSTSSGSSAFFEWGKQGGPLDQATPPRSLPSDANPYAISSAVSDLTPGDKLQYRLVVNREGQRYTGAIVNFQTSTAPNCVSGSTYQTVRVQRVVAVGCFRSAGQRWVAESFVRLNGLLLEPQGTARSGTNNHRFTCDTAACGALQTYLDSGNKFYIDQGGKSLGTTGAWKMSADTLEGMYHGTLKVDNVDWGGTAPLLSVGVDSSVELIDFPLAGQLTLTPSADGSTRLGLLVSMPVALGGVTGEAGVKVNPGGDVAFDRLKIQVGEIPIKGFSLGGLVFEYDRTQDLWNGEAELTIPSPSKVTIGAKVTVRNGQFSRFEGSASNLEIELAPGIFLQKISAGFGLDPIQLSGGIGFSAGPDIAGLTPIEVDSGFRLTAQSHYDADRGEWLPPSLFIQGQVSVFSIPIRSGSVEFFFTNQAWIEAHVDMGIDVKAGDLTLFRLGGPVDGALRGNTFEMSGEMGLNVAGYDVAKADAVLNLKGVAACGSVGPFGIGGYGTWSGNGGVIWFCNMDKLKSTLNNARVLRAAQSGPQKLTLPAHDKQALIQFTGQGHAPLVRLHGPGGRTIDSPAADATVTSQAGQFVSFRNEAAKETDVILADTGTGAWTYELLPGSAALAKVSTARPLPAISVRASVRRRRAREELSWKLRPIPGQKVTFEEEGKGTAPRVLKTTAAASGSVLFKPVPTLQRTRNIIAIVEQDGHPRKRLTVAHYSIAPVGKVTAVRSLKAKRKKTTVTVTWAKMPAAQSFRVTIVGSTGQRTLRVVKRPRLAVREKGDLIVKSVVVQAVGMDGKPGALKTVKVR